jgi:hypothetical protein
VDNLGVIDNEYVTRIIHYFLEGTDRKSDTKRSHNGPSRYFNRVRLEYKYEQQNDSNASADSGWIKGKIACRLTGHVGKFRGPWTCLIGMKPCNQSSKEERVK